MGETDGMTSKQKLAYWQQKFYDDANNAHAKGELVCWSSSIAPCEFTATMGIHTVYPENHAAAVGAKHGALEILEQADVRGYTLDNCSYARISLTYMELLMEEKKTGVTPPVLAKLDELKIPRLPLPDVVIVCNNICNVLLKWYENIAITLNIPYLLIDVPFITEYPIKPHQVKYIRDEFQRVIEQLEELTGKPFDYDKFREVQEQKYRSVKAWNKAMAMASTKPSPLNGFDMFNYMALIVCASCFYGAEDTFEAFAAELQEKADAGQDAFKGGEKSRIAWEGIAVWPYLSGTYKSLKKLGANMVGSTYPGAFAVLYEPGDLDSMAAGYAQCYLNTCLDHRVDTIADVMNNTGCDGIMYHLNRSCKNMGFMNMEIAEKVKAITKKPYVSFDGDQTDPRNFSQAQYDTRAEALSEIMLEQKETL